MCYSCLFVYQIKHNSIVAGFIHFLQLTKFKWVRNEQQAIQRCQNSHTIYFETEPKLIPLPRINNKVHFPGFELVIKQSGWLGQTSSLICIFLSWLKFFALWAWSNFSSFVKITTLADDQFIWFKCEIVIIFTYWLSNLTW